MPSKPWANTGLGDFKSWLGDTHVNDGLVYRGDADFEQLGPRGLVTVLEFKNPGEPLGRGQRAWLKMRAKQPKTEVRIIRELIGADTEDPDREVVVANPLNVYTQKMTLRELAEWVNSRAYRSGAELAGNHPTPLF